MENGQHSDEFRLELNSRRGEVIAWCASVAVGFAWLILNRNNQVVPKAIPFLAVLLVVSALSISLGNWMDRRTMIRLNGSGVAFKNGLRNVQLLWNEIQQVRVISTRWGSKVQVFGKNVFFEFRTYGEVLLSKNLTGRMGFRQGEKIMDQIILKADLQRVENKGDAYYYARQ